MRLQALKNCLFSEDVEDIEDPPLSGGEIYL